MPILDIQQRFRELGRIRTGYSEAKERADGSTYKQPKKSERLILSSQWAYLVEAAAELWGGTAKEWDNDGRQEFRVYVGQPTIPCAIPPGSTDAVLSQWWELWKGGGCERRCNGYEQTDGKKCACPSDLTERKALAAKGRACKPTSRLSVLLPDLPDIGVWRLETHSSNAAVELMGSLEFVSWATRQGYMVPAELGLKYREQRIPGEPTRKFYVPTLMQPRGSVNAFLEALGYDVDAGTPIALEGATARAEALAAGETMDRPALNAGGSPAPSRATPDDAPTRDPEPPAEDEVEAEPEDEVEGLSDQATKVGDGYIGIPPDELDEKAPRPDDTPPPSEEEPAADPEEQRQADAERSKLNQDIARRCKRLGLRRDVLVLALTQGRTGSARELDDREAPHAIEWLKMLADGRWALYLLEDGKAGFVEADVGIPEAMAAAYDDPDKIPAAIAERLPSTPDADPATPGPDEPAEGSDGDSEASDAQPEDDAIDAEVVAEEPAQAETSSDAPESAESADPPSSAEGWRERLRAAQVKVGPAMRAAQAFARKNDLEVPNTLEDVAGDPKLSALLVPWVEGMAKDDADG